MQLIPLPGVRLWMTQKIGSWNWTLVRLAKHYRPYLLAMSFGIVAIVAMTVLLSHSGNSLRNSPDYRSNRFCEGKCICDGGVNDAELMKRVCPKGWEPAYRSAKRKARSERRRRRIQRREQERKRQSLVPSV